MGARSRWVGRTVLVLLLVSTSVGSVLAAGGSFSSGGITHGCPGDPGCADGDPVGDHYRKAFQFTNDWSLMASYSYLSINRWTDVKAGVWAPLWVVNCSNLSTCSIPSGRVYTPGWECKLASGHYVKSKMAFHYHATTAYFSYSECRS